MLLGIMVWAEPYQIRLRVNVPDLRTELFAIVMQFQFSTLTQQQQQTAATTKTAPWGQRYHEATLAGPFLLRQRKLSDTFENY